MNKNLFTLSIGIPAYNEEANIKRLLSALLGQKEEGFVLKEVIVISDGSSDKTVVEARSITSDKIFVVDNKDRKGQAERQNDILKLFQGDILVLLNADVLPTNEYFLREIVKPFYTNENIGIVGAALSPQMGGTFFERVMSFGFYFRENIFLNMNNRDNLYLCRGAARAFSKEFTSTLKWPVDVVGEDVYSYLRCRSQEYSFSYQKSAVVMFRSPDNFFDYLKQSQRFVHSKIVFSQYFSEAFIDEQFRVPLVLKLKFTISTFVSHPIYFLYYCFAMLLTRLLPVNVQSTRSKWDIARSSKELR
ncbi:MAG: glycosyltransferase family 2 protein [Patescibacteria group bacterium]